MYEQKNQYGTISKIQALSMAHLYNVHVRINGERGLHNRTDKLTPYLANVAFH
jgi:hypothetical protein